MTGSEFAALTQFMQSRNKKEYFMINCYFTTPEVNESTGAFGNNAFEELENPLFQIGKLLWELPLIMKEYHTYHQEAPFGIIHKYGCCLRNRTMNNLRKSLITLPLINYNIQNSHLTTDNDKISIEQVESEINALEIFLKDYVISAKQLENLYEAIEKSKDQ
ncbi:2930_t:CDS:2 [Gigaspora margarita]|uniref:2930_t:CDS:1 n=1 Tax=Gigaspora margarita TaxID=4874 RepID=A0ABM8VZ17_GIGMA|nr:2930_t:CDS:2 [Gigaspora margarita]